MQALEGHELHGRPLVVRVARRAGARAPTPGQYLGPPKRRGGPREGMRRDARAYDRPPRREGSPNRAAPRAYDRAPADA